MRHRKQTFKLSRTDSHREALSANLVRGLIQHERITTTVSKARVSARIADKMITLAKKGDLHSRRRAMEFLQDKGLVKKLFSDLAPRFHSRQGGYTRMFRLGPRAGDAAPMAVIEFVEELTQEELASRKKHRSQKASGATATASAESPATPEAQVETDEPSKKQEASGEGPETSGDAGDAAEQASSGDHPETGDAPQQQAPPESEPPKQ